MLVMSSLSYQGRRSGVVPAGNVGDFTVLSKSADQAVAANAVITFDGVAYGNTTLFSDAADTLTIPTGITLARLSGGFFETNSRNGFRKSGSLSYDGVTQMANRNQGKMSFASPPLAVSSGDAFDFYDTIRTSSGTHAGQPYTWFAIELMDPATKYCVAQKSADSSLSAGGITNPIAWDGTDIADANAMHDPASNNSRINIPSGVTLARPFFMLEATGATGEFVAWTDKTGASGPGRVNVDLENNNGAYVCGYGAIVPVTGGTDYFTCGIFSVSAATLKGGSQHSYFGVECFGSSYSYCTAYKSATQALTANVAATLLLESEVADTDNCHSTSSNKGDFVCPSGKTKARMSFNIKTANSTATFEALGMLNGSQVRGMPQSKLSGASEANLNAMGSWITVAPGDILTVQVTSTAGQTLPTANETWVCVEWA